MHTNSGIDLKEILKKTPEEICSDRQLFDELIYTDLNEAVEELHRRRKDQKITKKLKEFLGNVPIPEPLLTEPKLILFRQIATPNYETARFLMAADSVDIEPLFFEYLDDIFHAGNYAKKYLGKLAFHEGYGKKNGSIISYHNVIDFNNSNGKKMREVETYFNKKLHDLHHDFFTINYKHINDKHIYDASEWFKKAGGTPEKYYKYFLGLTIQNGILFENFVLDNDPEFNFTKNIILKSFINVYNYFEERPLIVATEPTEIESQIFWECHNQKTKTHINKNILKK